jgi:hypothetical protein
MKIHISSFCWQCFNETDRSSESYEKIKKETGSRDLLLEFNEDNSYIIECSKGHKSESRLQNQKFELLFDMGAMALNDGYSKECVSTLASSLERFIEFVIKFVCTKHSIEVENYIKMWKQMSNQSERQLGAFYALQTIEFGYPKFSLDNNKVTFRNKVVHKGYIPSKQEALEFGQYVLDFIVKCSKELKLIDEKSFDKALHFDFYKNGVRIPLIQLQSSMQIPSIISGFMTIEETPDFEKSANDILTNSFYNHFYHK